VIAPQRRPPGGELTGAQQQHNPALARHRVVVENVLAAAKSSSVMSGSLPLRFRSPRRDHFCDVLVGCPPPLACAHPLRWPMVVSVNAGCASGGCWCALGRGLLCSSS